MTTSHFNKQKPEHKDLDQLRLDVHSIFYTIQGEGPFAGTPAVFIRLAGCNLQCPLCDTEYTKGRTKMTHDEIVAEVIRVRQEGGARNRGLVVITGGEPFRQDLRLLLTLLEKRGQYIQIETNGRLEPSVYAYNFNFAMRAGAYIVVSPKKGKLNEKIASLACAFKYVVRAGETNVAGLPTSVLGYRKAPEYHPDWWNGPIYIQPADEKDDEKNLANLNEALNVCMKHGYILQLQIHKILGME